MSVLTKYNVTVIKPPVCAFNFILFSENTKSEKLINKKKPNIKRSLFFYLLHSLKNLRDRKPERRREREERREKRKSWPSGSKKKKTG